MVDYILNKDLQIQLPEAVATAISALNAAGFEAYLVGGSVRDAYLGMQPTDWDLTTSARPEETKAVFADCRTIDIGIAHGTVTVLIDSLPIEITTYRTDGEYIDCRHPVKVEFARTLEADLARRDFTINAMAYHPTEGLVDYFGGRRDADRRVIRAVGDSEKRFSEDALRIMRALRLAATLGFEIDEATARGLTDAKDLLQAISAERVNIELSRLICGDHAVPTLRKYREIIAVVIPELVDTFDFEQHSPYHCYDVWEHILHTMEAIPAEVPLRLAMLLHDIGKPLSFETVMSIGHFYNHANLGESMAKDILQRLRYSNETIDRILPLIKYHDTELAADEYTIKRWLNKHGEQFMYDLVAVKRADNKGQNPKVAYRQADYDKLASLIDKVITEEQCFKIADLAINGNDLLALGFKADKDLGITLNALLESVMQDDIPNTKEALIERAKFINRHSTYFD